MTNRWKRIAAAGLAAALVACNVPAMAVDQSVSVVVDEQAVTFANGVRPVIRGGRTYVPFRAIFEKMGATVGWDAATRTVSAERDGTVAQFSIGKTAAAVTQQGETHLVQTDAPSFLSEGRTLVPVRFAAQAFGATVGWDAAARTVLIVDTDKLRRTQDETYETMNRYLEFISPAGMQAVQGNFSVNLTLQDTVRVPITVRFDGVQSEDGGNLTVRLQAETSQLAANKDAVDSGLASLILAQNGRTYECLYRLTEDTLYLRSDALTSENIPQGAWVRLPLDKILGQLTGGEVSTAMLRAKASHEYADLVAAMAQNTKLDAVSADTVSLVRDVLEKEQLLHGDSAFVRQGDMLQASSGDFQNGVSASLQLQESDGKIGSAEQYDTLAQNSQLLYEKRMLWQADGTQTCQIVIGGQSYQAEVTGEVVRTPSFGSIPIAPTGKILPE